MFKKKSKRFIIKTKLPNGNSTEETFNNFQEFAKKHPDKIDRLLKTGQFKAQAFWRFHKNARRRLFPVIVLFSLSLSIAIVLLTNPLYLCQVMTSLTLNMLLSVNILHGCHAYHCFWKDIRGNTVVVR